MPRILSPLVWSSCLLLSQTFTAAKPLHRNHEAAHQNGAEIREAVIDPIQGALSEISKFHESRSTLRDAAAALSKSHPTISKRSWQEKQEEEGSTGRWGSWRSWGPYAATRPGNYVPDPDADTKLNDLLSDFDSSFEALLNYFADEYTPQPSSGNSPNSAPSQTQQNNHTSSISSSQPSDIIYDPFPSIQPITQPAASAATHSFASSPTSNSNSGYTFDPSRPDLTVVYYAQSPATLSVPLPSLCSDPDIDIVILSFLSHFFSTPTFTPSQ